MPGCIDLNIKAMRNDFKRANFKYANGRVLHFSKNLGHAILRHSKRQSLHQNSSMPDLREMCRVHSGILFKPSLETEHEKRLCQELVFTKMPKNVIQSGTVRHSEVRPMPCKTATLLKGLVPESEFIFIFNKDQTNTYKS